MKWMCWLSMEWIKVYSFSKNCNVYNPLFILKLVKMMRNYDIVHTHNTAPQLFAAIGSVVCSVVLVTTEHTTSNRRRDWKWYTPIDRWMYKRYNKVICISNQAEENLKAFHPSLKNVCTIYNGVDVQKFHDAKPLECIRSEKRIKTRLLNHLVILTKIDLNYGLSEMENVVQS